MEDGRKEGAGVHDWLLVFASHVPEEEAKVRMNMIRAIKASGLVTLSSKSGDGPPLPAILPTPLHPD
jgi:hypothetical protein